MGSPISVLQTRSSPSSRQGTEAHRSEMICPVLLLETWFQSPIPLLRLQRPQRSMQFRGKKRRLNWEPMCNSCQDQMGKWEVERWYSPSSRQRAKVTIPNPSRETPVSASLHFASIFCIYNVVLLFLSTVGSASLNTSWKKKQWQKMVLKPPAHHWGCADTLTGKRTY